MEEENKLRGGEPEERTTCRSVAEERLELGLI